MKRFISVTLMLCVSAAFSFAQDIIVMRNSTEIQAKIRNIGQTEITYSKWSNQDGPTYTISKSEVRYIQYANGEKDVFENTRPTVSANGSNASNGSYSASAGNYSGNNGSYSAGGGYQSNTAGVASGSYSSSTSNSSPFSSNVNNSYGTVNIAVQQPKGAGMYKAGLFLTVFGGTYSGILLITAAITGEDSLFAIAAPGFPCILAGIPLWIVGANKMKKSTQALTYVPVAEHTVELGNLALVPSVGVTNDMISNRQSISAGLTLKF